MNWFSLNSITIVFWIFPWTRSVQIQLIISFSMFQVDEKHQRNSSLFGIDLSEVHKNVFFRIEKRQSLILDLSACQKYCYIQITMLWFLLFCVYRNEKWTFSVALSIFIESDIVQKFWLNRTFVVVTEVICRLWVLIICFVNS